MKNVKYRNFHPDDAQAMTVLQHRALEYCPDTGKFEAGFWLSPGFQEGKNIMIAETTDSRIVGYAAISSAYYSNTLEARVFWIDLRSDPDLDGDSTIKDNLLEKIIQRGWEIKSEENRDCAAVGATYFAQGQNCIDYLKSHGFAHFETMLAMRRNLSEPIPIVERIATIEIKSWKMEKRSEKLAYLQARELAFEYPLGSVELLEHFSRSELWQGGTSFAAFADQGKIIASIMALSNGLLDYVFVIPEWRRKGIAKILVAKALDFLRSNGHSQAWLEVYSHNQAAINLYHQFGFERFKEEISLGHMLD
jgi:GNAT superfamily N-acetyltransferase